ncbi:TPA: hypothetical protein TU158_001742 [Streptococcus equi subsp. zooepidemicus]|nr:hypothetical protein [Streptococcus equi subsp. zooepidemicus]
MRSNKVSQKYHVEIYQKADEEEKEFLRKLIRMEIIFCFNYLSFHGLFLDGKEEFVQEVSRSHDYKKMVELRWRLRETADSVKRLEKYFVKAHKAT